jgi:hypothetical protein
METPFDIKYENGTYKIKNGRDLCLEFEFIKDGTVLYISKIRKCGDGKPLTREMIKMIEHMAKSIPVPPWSLVEYITMEDGSSIHVCTVDIDLRYLKILTTGESWYNSFGYKSLNYDAEVAHNADIINKPMAELLSELYGDSEYKEKFKKRFPELSTTDLTVKEYVTAMSEGIPRSGTRKCTKDQDKRATLLFNLVHSIRRNEILQYDLRLQKKVNREPSSKGSSKGGGGTKRNLRKSRTRTCKSIKRKTR